MADAMYVTECLQSDSAFCGGTHMVQLARPSHPTGCHMEASALYWSTTDYITLDSLGDVPNYCHTAVQKSEKPLIYTAT